MLVTRFDPIKEFASMQKFFNNYHANEENAISAFAPSVNTREGEYAYHIEVDLPGIEKENISIDVNDGVLTLYGERKYKDEVKKEDYYKLESSFGKFQRVFTLPKSVDTENISAEFKNGVLEVVIPKFVQETTKKKIEIK